MSLRSFVRHPVRLRWWGLSIPRWGSVLWIVFVILGGGLVIAHKKSLSVTVGALAIICGIVLLAILLRNAFEARKRSPHPR
jgi:hypothetical protein